MVTLQSLGFCQEKFWITRLIIENVMSCDSGHAKNDHDCRLNFTKGSAKAMEADAGEHLINNSEILKEVRVSARVVIGDDDSSTIAAVRKNRSEIIYKLSDKNHLLKHISNNLYDLAKNFKEMKKKKCDPTFEKMFFLCCCTKQGSEHLVEAVRSIADHAFDRHDNCGKWCEESTSHTIKLQNRVLYQKLKNTFNKYANNSEKFCVAASNQSNESVK